MSWRMIAGVLTVGFSPATCLAAGIAPALVGYYQAVHYVVSATVKGAGQCTDSAGTYWNSTTYYPGPSKPGTTDWRVINLPTYLGEFVASFGIQPAPGVNTGSGAYTIKILPAGQVVHGTYKTTTTPLDARSSIASSTFTYPTSAGGTCTVSEQVNYTFSGH